MYSHFNAQRLHRLPLCLLVLNATLGHGAPAQAPRAAAPPMVALPPAKPRLELNLEARDVVNGVPTTFHIILRNTGERSIRLPEPSLGCASTMDGTVWLMERVTPPPPGDGHGYGCAADRFSSSPDILVRAKGWILLTPGGYLERVASPDRMHYENHGAGTYDLWAEYVPPQVSADERKRLLGADIAYPQAKLTSPRVVLKKQR